MKQWILWSIIGILAVVLGIVLFNNIAKGKGSPHRETVEEFNREFIKVINDSLSNPNDEIRRRVEKAHVTVDVYYAKVSGIKVKTIDGSNYIGENFENIDTITIDIKTNWDGIFHKGGTTILRLNIDMQGKTINGKIVYTDAMVNIEDPNFWVELGTAVMLLL